MNENLRNITTKNYKEILHEELRKISFRLIMRYVTASEL